MSAETDLPVNRESKFSVDPPDVEALPAAVSGAVDEEAAVVGGVQRAAAIPHDVLRVDGRVAAAAVRGQALWEHGAHRVDKQEAKCCRLLKSGWCAVRTRSGALCVSRFASSAFKPSAARGLLASDVCFRPTM